jgi:hypothetical protein
MVMAYTSVRVTAGSATLFLTVPAEFGHDSEFLTSSFGLLVWIGSVSELFVGPCVKLSDVTVG